MLISAVVGFTVISLTVLGYIVYLKVFQPLLSITLDLHQATLEHHIFAHLEEITNKQGLSEYYNLMLDNNMLESDYLEQLQQRLTLPKKLNIMQSNHAAISLLNNIENQKKHIKYH